LTPLDHTKLVTAPRTSLSTTAVRHLSPKHNPGSGEGARINGGRFNPPESFPTLYLCETRSCRSRN
jgi:RES domain-containing protein